MPVCASAGVFWRRGQKARLKRSVAGVAGPAKRRLNGQFPIAAALKYCSGQARGLFSSADNIFIKYSGDYPGAAPQVYYYQHHHRGLA